MNTIKEVFNSISRRTTLGMIWVFISILIRSHTPNFFDENGLFITGLINDVLRDARAWGVMAFFLHSLVAMIFGEKPLVGATRTGLEALAIYLLCFIEPIHESPIVFPFFISLGVIVHFEVAYQLGDWLWRYPNKAKRKRVGAEYD